jgi:hypothetical protein
MTFAAAQDVGGGDLLGDVQRLVEREQHEPEVDAHVRGLGHDPAEERHLLQVLPRRAAVVHAVGDRRVAERVGQSRLLRELAEARLHVVPAGNWARIIRPNCIAVGIVREEYTGR